MKNKYSKLTLSNGLRLILVPDENKDVVTTIIAFGVGSRYEDDSVAGISHILEHMHFKGTKKRPTPLQIAEFIEEIGGENNAFTGKEYTGYYAKVPSKHLERSIDFLSDLLIGSLFDPEELEKEKGVILQELDMYEDQPMDVAASRFEVALFGKNALGRDVIGTKKSIVATDRDDLISYRDKYYVGNNAVVVVSGNFGGLSEDQVAALVEKYFTFRSADSIKYPKVTLNKKRANVIVNKKTEQSQLVIGFPGCSHTDPDRHALKILASILGGSMSSRMFTEIREKRGLAYAVHTSVSSFYETGSIETMAGVPHARVEETIKAIIGEYKKITDDVTEVELARTKEYIQGRLLIDFEDSTELASHYLIDELLMGEIDTPAELVGKYQKVTLNDVRRVARKYLDFSRLTLSYVGPVIEDKQLEKLIKKY